MKTIIHSLFGVILCATICFISNSCSKKESPEIPQKGKLKLTVGISVTESKGLSLLKAGTDDFSVQIFNSNNELVVSFAHVTDIPDAVELPAGSYYAIASSNSNPAAAFENPFYSGNSGAFSIVAGQTSAITITCSLANIRVTVVYSDRVKNFFTNYSTTVKSSSDSLVFVKTETRVGYFKSGPLSIRTDLYNSNKATPSKILTGEIANPKPGKHYEIHIDTTPTEGSAAVNVVLNDTVETEIINITDAGQGSSEPVYGDLLITEIMYNPLALSDSEGEWIEVYNNSKKNINLKGLVLRRGSASSFHQISSDVNLAAGTYAVLGRTSAATDNVRYVYGSLALTNTGDELIINTYGTNGLDGTVICSVDYSTEGFLTNLDGKSLQLDPSVKNVEDAKIGTNWCASTLTYSTGDYGTPGLANSACQ